MDSFRLIILGVSILGAATITLCSATSVHAKQCSAERPANARSYWSYRLIDGRKCWYEGKQMISKSLLHWPTSKPAQAAAAKSNVARGSQRSLLDAQASISNAPAAKPNMEVKQEIADDGQAPVSERKLTPDHLRAWGNSMAVIAAEPILTIMDRWPDAELPRQQREAATVEAWSLPSRMVLMVTILLMAVGAVLISVNFQRRALPEA